MRDESLTDGDAVAGYDVHDAGRDGVRDELGEAEQRERRQLGRFQDRDVAARFLPSWLEVPRRALPSVLAP
ncbi:MAG TPA: hypothetical protein VJ986_07775 [Gaiellaceae bacterium]|nr:hypothetical protein [Gaiellaceae bacterium]